MNLFKNKHCPRCKQKMPIEVVQCPNCLLSFTKFETATNKEAKEAIKSKEHDRVLMRVGFPSDVNKLKLLLLTIFLGFTGAHYYYVGRYKMGIFFSIFFCVGITNAILTLLIDSVTDGLIFEIFYLLVLVWGFVIMLWIVDIAKICLNRFKIPVGKK